MLFKNNFQITISSPTYINLNYLFYYLLFIITQNKISNLKIYSNQLPTKIKKFTILKSPHIYKTARTQLELRTLKKSIKIRNFTSKHQINLIKKIANHLIKYLPNSIKLNVKYQKLLYI